MKGYINKNQRIVLALVGLFILSSVAGVVQVAAQIVTPQQVKQLKNLSESQKQLIIQELGIKTSSVKSSNQTSDVQIIAPTDAPLQSADDNKLRLAPNDLLMIELKSDEPKDISLVGVRRSLGKNIYTLDNNGYLKIAGLKGILLAGLTVEQAQLRLEAEPLLRQLIIGVKQLPVNPVGSLALQRYGLDLFRGSPTTFAPSGNIPVPLDFIVGPGDTISLLIYGQQNADYRLTVGRDGSINVPQIGPVAIAGMKFDRIREELTKRIQERYIGVETSITMGELRSIQVFVLGDVNHPGSYTVSSLSNMTNALFVSGGIAQSGSMREIQLKRNNRVVGSLDLYDFLLNGNTKDDLRIRSGDVLYVPPVGSQVSVYGHVTRPAIYELKDERDLPVIIRMAGGLLPSANKHTIKIERFDDDNKKSLLVSDLQMSGHTDVRDGDKVEVLGGYVAGLNNVITVKGHVIRETESEWRPGIRLINVLPDPRVFETGADQNYVLIHREDESTGRTSLMSSNWRRAYEDRNSAYNTELHRLDTIYVFDLGEDRSTKIAPLITELQAQSSNANPIQLVSVHGRVRSPGVYPLESSMRVSDLVRASGSILERAYLDEVELTRMGFSSSGAKTVHVPLNLSELVEGGEQDLLLRHSDVLTIKEIPLWREHRRVSIHGEIEFPGSYAASRGERLSSLIRRAGGLTPMAFPNGSVFLREDLKEREDEQLQILERRLRAEIGTLGNDNTEARGRGEVLLNQLDATEAVGRLVIDLNLVLSGDSDHDVILKDGDKLVIPPRSQEVTVIGEVQYPTSHIYQRGLDHFSYINKSGGATSNSDFGRIYIIRADGNVVAQGSSNWFRRSGRAIDIHPGDTIVVPFDADRVGSLTLWSSVSQIVYNIGVAAAAVASF